VPAYSFYCCNAQDLSGYFEQRELPDDFAAQDHARRLLSEHRSAAYVQVVCGDTELRVERSQPGRANGGLDLEAALETTSKAFPDVAIIVTGREGTVAYWNRTAVSLYGWRTEEALGRNILDLTPARQSHGDAAVVMQALSAGGDWQGEMVLKGRDGRPFRAFVANFVAPGADAPLIVGLSVPVDARRTLDRSRVEIEEQIRAALP
jgi:PAS domain S-box-containing protein